MLFIIGQSGPLWVAVMLMSPVLLIFIVYGVVLFFKKDKPEQVINFSSPDSITSLANKKSYKHGIVFFIIGLVFFLLAYLLVQNIRSSTGYSGSEGEIGAFPLMISGAVFVLLSVISVIISFLTNLFTDK